MPTRRRGPVWKPTPSDFRAVLEEQNPWHPSGEVPEALARPVERPLARLLHTRITSTGPQRFQFILGPRRVGKSTTMYQTVRHLLRTGLDPMRLWWLRLDHPLLIETELGGLVRLIQSAAGSPDSPVYLFLDELIYARDWDLWLKTFYDERWPVRIVATSSATAAMRQRRLESGVGRWEEQQLSPYLFDEYLELVGEPAPSHEADSLDQALRIATAPGAEIAAPSVARRRRQFLLTGGFPELLNAFINSDDDEQSRLLESQRTLRTDAVERAVYKDIPQSFGVDNPLMLERLLYVLAGQCAGLLSPTSICASLDRLSQPTFDRYLAYLERAFIVFTLPNYSGAEKNVQRRGKKLYFVDGAVRNAALQRGLTPLKDPVEMGLLLENLAASHLHALGQQAGIRLYHWRDGRNEVDLIYDHFERPLAFEIASSPRHSRGGLLALVERYPRFAGRCYLIAPDAPACPADASPDGIGVCPLDTFLLVTGALARRHLEARLSL